MLPAERAELDDLRRRVAKLESATQENGPLERRVFSQFDFRVQGITSGLEAHVKSAIRSELAPYLDKLSELTSLSETLKGHREILEKAVKILTRQEAAAELAKEARDSAEAAEQSAARRWTRRTPILVLVGAIITALASIVTAAIVSHYK